MTDTYRCFADLLEHNREGVDFHRTCIDRGGPVLVLAPHGGRIERGTSELASAIAGDDFSLYLFEGKKSTARESKVLHITSANFDDPLCLELIQKFPKAVAIHGCEGEENLILVGGKDRELKNRLIAALKARGYPAKSGTGGLAGTEPMNICNRTRSGQGVQVEFSQGMRQKMFEDWETLQGRKTTTPVCQEIVAEIRGLFV